VKKGHLRAVNGDAGDIEVFEKINGIISTPTLSDSAVRRRLAELGSSPMERFSAERRAANQREAHVPELHFAASAAEAFSSMVGRNWLTGIKNGTMRTRTIKNGGDDKDDAELAFMTTPRRNGRSPRQREERIAQ